MHTRYFRIGALIAGAVTVFGAALLAMHAPAASTTATFDGAPAAPLPYPQVSPLDGWDIQVHDRDAWAHPGTSPSLNAEHGADCSPPPATHSTGTDVSAHVYQCANHIMTALDSDNTGYSVIYLTPPEMVDFSSSGTVSWDMSTERDSTRDWIDVWVTPFADNLSLPLDDWLPDLQGPPKNSIHIKMEAFNGETVFGGEVFQNGQQTDLSFCWWCTIPANTTSAMLREKFELRLTPNHIWFGMPGRNIVWIDQDIALSFTTGIVQFGHHSYTPTKNNSGTPGTWHWDNVQLTPSIPFFIEREQDWTRGGTVTTSPAPANAYLRFSGICRVKVDGVLAQRAAYLNHPEHFSPYFVPVAPGSTQHQISFVPETGFSGSCLAKDFALWSLTSSTVSTSTVPAPTATSVAPTATPSSVPATATHTPTQSPSSTPTSPATETPTATPSPTPKVCRARRGTSIFGQVLYTGTIQNGVCVP